MNQEQSWWNRPIYLRDLIGTALPFQKEEVPEDLVALHNRALTHAQNLARPIESVDIVPIREEYKPQQYKQPKEFKQEIPGLPIYQKYHEYMV